MVSLPYCAQECNEKLSAVFVRFLEWRDIALQRPRISPQLGASDIIFVNPRVSVTSGAKDLVFVLLTFVSLSLS